MEATFTCDALTKRKARFVSPKGDDGKTPVGDVQGSLYLDKNAGYQKGDSITVTVEPSEKS